MLGFGLAELWDSYRLALLAAHRDLRIDFIELDYVDQYQAVLTKRVDVAIVHNIGPVQGVDQVTVFQTPRVAVVPNDSRWARATSLDETDFCGATWLPAPSAEYAAWAGQHAAEYSEARPGVRSPSAFPAAVATTGLPGMQSVLAQQYHPHPGVQFRPIIGAPCKTAIATRTDDQRQHINTFRTTARELGGVCASDDVFGPTRRADARRYRHRE